MSDTNNTQQIYLATDDNGQVRVYLNEPTYEDGFFNGVMLVPTPGHFLAITYCDMYESHAIATAPLHWETIGTAKRACSEQTGLFASVDAIDGQNVVMISNRENVMMAVFYCESREAAIAKGEKVLASGLIE